MPNNPLKPPDQATRSLASLNDRIAERLRQKTATMSAEELASADPLHAFHGGRWVYLLIDCSSSMTPSKLAEATAGSRRFLTDAIAARYQVGVIVFADEPKRLSEPTADPDQVGRLLNDGLSAPGTSTALDKGLAAARSDLVERSGNRAIVVVTDGMPNDEALALAEATIAKEAGIDIIAIGTEDANLSFLERLASAKRLASQRAIGGAVADAIANAARLLPSRT